MLDQIGTSVGRESTVVPITECTSGDVGWQKKSVDALKNSQQDTFYMLKLLQHH